MNSLIKKLSKSHQDCPQCPSPKLIHTFFESVLGLLFPDFASEILKEEEQVAEKIEELKHKLSQVLLRNKPFISKNTSIEQVKPLQNMFTG